MGKVTSSKRLITGWFGCGKGTALPEWIEILFKRLFLAGLLLVMLSGLNRYSPVEAGYRLEGNSITGSLKVPRSLLKGNYYRLNFAFMDVDDPRPLYHSVLWWKPPWNASGDYPGSGVIIIED